MRKNNHIQVDFFYRLLPHWFTRPMSVAVDVLRVLFLGYCVWLTYLLTEKIGKLRMAIVDWPMGIVYAFVGRGIRADDVARRRRAHRQLEARRLGARASRAHG